MATMKAAQIFGPNDMRIVDLPVPTLGPHDVLCKVVRTGICGTDHAIYTGEISFIEKGMIKFPMTPGHEWSATVAAVGDKVDNFKVNDRVVGDTCVACGQCYACLMGQYGQCKQMQAVGTIFTWDGAYAEYIVMPQRHLFHLPESVSFDQGALVEPAATALYAVRLADVTIGDTVLVHGTGPIGIAAAKLAKLSGATKVIITGRKPFKLQKALELGADVAINTTEQSIDDVVRDTVGPDGVDCVIEASGSLELFRSSFDSVRIGGTISVVAFYEKNMDQFDIDKFVMADVKLRAVAGSLGMYRPVLRLMEVGMLDLSSLITARYPFEQAPQALKDMSEKNDKRIKMLLEFPQD